MQRKDFIKTIFAAGSVVTLGSTLQELNDKLPENDVTMPVLFVGHGSPMNAIESNEFTKKWKAIADSIPRPKAILCISAHWLTQGTFVNAVEKPKTIHDFGGFPKALFDTEYPAAGDPILANEVAGLFKDVKVGLDQEWGFDHGAWSVALPMYPNADIPMLQLSIDYHQSGEYHYELAKNLSSLRKKGVLILSSGNMVHNLRLCNFTPGQGGYDWAIEMNETFKKHILDGNHAPLQNYRSLGKAAELAIPTPDHYYPLLYVLALQGKNEKVEFFNDKAIAGSLTMTSVLIND
jgi:4,5-DOPA dioxygenase extradiol